MNNNNKVVPPVFPLFPLSRGPENPSPPPSATDYRSRIADACARGERRACGIPRTPKKPRAVTLRSAPERVEQVHLARWLDRYVGHDYWHHTPNEGRRSYRTAGSLRAQGLKRGVPDVLIFLPPPRGGYVGVAMELKRLPERGTKPRATEEQLERLRALARCGWFCCVCWGADAAVRVLVHDLGYNGPAPDGATGMVEVIS